MVIFLTVLTIVTLAPIFVLLRQPSNTYEHPIFVPETYDVPVRTFDPTGMA